MNKNIERWVYGKKFIKVNDKEKVRILKRTNFILHLCFIPLLLILIMALLPIYISPTKEITPEINLSELNEEEKEIVMNIITDIKPEYLNQRSIRIVKNKTFYMEYISPEAGGYNRFSGDITLKFNDDEYLMRVGICHELLHSYMKLSETAHRIVYDVAEYLPCYHSTERIKKVAYRLYS